jgi:hypothetical protein
MSLRAGSASLPSERKQRSPGIQTGPFTHGPDAPNTTFIVGRVFALCIPVMSQRLLLSLIGEQPGVVFFDI